MSRKIIILNKFSKETVDDDYYTYDVQYSIPVTTDWTEVSEEEFDLLVKHQYKLKYIVVEKCVRSIDDIIESCRNEEEENKRIAKKRAEAAARKKQKQQEKKKLSKQKEKEEELLLLQELKKKYES